MPATMTEHLILFRQHVLPKARAIVRLLLSLMLPALLWMTSPIAHAGDMRDCVQLTSEQAPGQNKNRAVLVNNCSARVYVFWCHVGGGAYPCKEPKHYRQGRYFSPGERYHNSYALPERVSINYGACSGMYTRIKYGASGTYQCPSENSGIEGAGPRHSQAQCDGNRRVDFDWQLKGENEKVAVVQLKDGAVQIPLAEYRAFEKKPNGQPPAALVRRLCSGYSGTVPEAGVVTQMKGKLRQHADEIEREFREKCAKKNNEGDECQRFREPRRRTPQAGGPQG